MGQVYVLHHGRKELCCDYCGQSAGDGHRAYRRPCPAGQCPPTSLCSSCLDELTHSGEWAVAHAGCRVAREAKTGQLSFGDA